MEERKKISNRFYRIGFLLLCGLVAIAYGGMGFLYVQQGIKQGDLNEKVETYSAILAKPLSSIDELQAEYDAITENLTPIGNVEAIERLVAIAEKYGIDTTEGIGKFTLPPAVITNEQVGATSYRVLTYRGVLVQGIEENVVGFLNDIEKGITWSNIVMSNLTFTQSSTTATGDDAARRRELNEVQEAVRTMMADNSLYFIYNPVSAEDGRATNYMGDDPGTPSVQEGFPDTDTDKYYTGSADIKNGYMLYEHDKVDTENTELYTTASYIDTFMTEYYYTCDSNGTVHQYDGPIIAEASEYGDTSMTISHLTVTLNIKIYTKE